MKDPKSHQAEGSPAAAAHMRSRSEDEGAWLACGGGGHHTCGDRRNLHPVTRGKPLSPLSHSRLTPALSSASIRMQRELVFLTQAGPRLLLTHYLLTNKDGSQVLQPVWCPAIHSNLPGHEGGQLPIQHQPQLPGDEKSLFALL